MKFFAGFFATLYLLAVIVFGVVHHRGHPEGSFFDAVAGGVAWLGLAWLGLAWPLGRDCEVPKFLTPLWRGSLCGLVGVGKALHFLAGYVFISLPAYKQQTGRTLRGAVRVARY